MVYYRKLRSNNHSNVARLPKTLLLGNHYNHSAFYPEKSLPYYSPHGKTLWLQRFGGLCADDGFLGAQLVFLKGIYR